ncbi:MAG: hypothetical protein GY851_11395 [bacterium]|nr:hypothetical protein [bacterium]
MEVSSDFMGVKAKPLEVEVSWRHAMNFAASVGDANPIYFDDERADGTLAPPMLAVALTWRVAGDFETYWDHPGFPLDALRQQVHYLEHLEWYRPLIPGDRLLLQGEVLAVAPHRGGTIVVLRFDATDDDGRLVFREDVGALLRRVRCPDGGRGTENLPQPPRFESDEPPLWDERIHIDPLASHIYDGCADVQFPIHTSKAFARNVGLPSTILHGTATLALAARELTNREADGDPSRLKSINCRFTGMVLPGTDIHVRALGSEPVDGGTRVFFDVLNSEGRKALSDGYATIAAG